MAAPRLHRYGGWAVLVCQPLLSGHFAGGRGRPRRTMRGLSECQARVLDFICHEVAGGRPPSLAEIGEEFGVTVQTAAGHVRALETKEWIRRRPGHRGLEPTDRAWTRQVRMAQEQDARARLPRGINGGGAARALATIRSALLPLGTDQRQLVLGFLVE